MLVLRVQEFIKELSLKESTLDPKDAGILHLLKEKFLLSESETPLTINDINVLKDMFAERWARVRDKSGDYTVYSPESYSEWLTLARHLASESGEPVWRVLMPTAKNDFDPDNFANLNQQLDPRELYFGDDGTWHSLQALFRKLCKKPENLTILNDAKLPVPHILTLSELLRIRNKYPYEIASFGQYHSFWEFLVAEISPSWHPKNKFNPQLLYLLHDVIEAYFFEEEKDKKVRGLQKVILGFSNYLSKCSIEEVTQFYGVKLEIKGERFLILDILLDCMQQQQPTEEISEKLLCLANWIYTQDRSVIVKNQKLLAVYESVQTSKFFNISALKTVVESLPIKISPIFSCKLESLEQQIITKKQFTMDLIDELRSLLATPLQDIIETSVELNLQDLRTNFWQYLIQQYAEGWQSTGELPHHLLPDLLDLIDAYYQRSDAPEKVNHLLFLFIEALRSCPIKDVNHFYSIVIDYKGKKTYLLELLIDGLLQSPDLPEKLQAIAGWIYTVDHSLVSQSKPLEVVYQAHNAGHFFKIQQLRESLMQLNTKAGSLSQSCLGNVIKSAARASTIDGELIKKIIALYAVRWREVIDTPEDPMRQMKSSWVTLAQNLAGARLISFSYYKLLIPTLTSEVDILTGERLTRYPLPNYIVAGNGRTLIFLPYCISNHESRGTFYNCNHANPQPLTPKEKQRLEHAAFHFGRYYKEAEAKQNELYVSSTTIQAVKELAQESVYAVGLILHEDYSTQQLAKAYIAYKKFLDFRENLPDDERDHLDGQQILLGNARYTFYEILVLILNQGECIANYGKYFIKLVIDYAPETRFSAELELKADIPSMRLWSAKKVYSDHENLTQQEAIYRVKSIFVSLMTHSFTFYGSGVPIGFWDCTNLTTKTGGKLFDELKGMIISNNFEHARFIYTKMLSNIVQPALNDKSRSASRTADQDTTTWLQSIAKSVSTSCTRYQDTTTWLQSIVDNSIAEPQNTHCFEPGHILSVLNNYIEKTPNARESVEAFLDQIIHTLAQKENTAKKWVRINIKFSEFLLSRDEMEQEKILSLLRSARLTPLPILSRVVTNVVLGRMAYYTTAAMHRTSSRFFHENIINMTDYRLLLEQFHDDLNTRGVKDNIPISLLLKTLRTVATSVVGAFEKRVLAHSMSKLRKIFPAESTPRGSVQAVC